MSFPEIGRQGIRLVAGEQDDAGNESHRRFNPIALPVKYGRLIYSDLTGGLLLRQPSIKPTCPDVVALGC